MFGILSQKKQCTKCKEWKPFGEFYKDSRNKCGLHSYCKKCDCLGAAKWEKDNWEKIKGRKQEAGKRARKNRPSSPAGKQSPERHSANSRKSYWNNIEKERERSKLYRMLHPEKETARWNNRRCRIKNNGGKITGKEWGDLKALYNYTCLCCGRREPEIKLSLDHVLPIDKGGLNVIENAQCLCISCNSKKGVKHIDYRP